MSGDDNTPNIQSGSKAEAGEILNDSLKRRSTHLGPGVAKGPPAKVPRRTSAPRLVYYDNDNDDDDDDDNDVNNGGEDEVTETLNGDEDADEEVEMIADDDGAGVGGGAGGGGEGTTDAPSNRQGTAEFPGGTTEHPGEHRDTEGAATTPATPVTATPSDEKTTPQVPYMGQDVVLPQPKAARCPPGLQEKITTLYNKTLREGKSLARVIESTKKFRNPTIYEKIVDFLKIDDNGTNYPPELYNPRLWGPESRYRELARVQNEEASRPAPSQPVKRVNSKWDL